MSTQTLTPDRPQVGPGAPGERSQVLLASLAIVVCGVTAWSSGFFAPEVSYGTQVRATKAAQQAGPMQQSNVLHEGPLSGPQAAELCGRLIDEGNSAVAEVKDFQATFYSQQRLRDRLKEPETTHIKMRAEPLSVYMKWVEPKKGRELLWNRDTHDGELLIHECGWKGKIAPLVKISPDHRLVAESCRRGIHEVGLWKLMTLIAENRSLLKNPGVEVELTTDQSIGDRACYCFSIKVPEPTKQMPHYLVTLYLDKERKLPLGCEIYDAPSDEGGEPILCESYFYENLEWNVGLTDLDFDHTNPDYCFGKGAATTDVP